MFACGPHARRIKAIFYSGPFVLDSTGPLKACVGRDAFALIACSDVSSRRGGRDAADDARLVMLRVKCCGLKTATVTASSAPPIADHRGGGQT